MSYSQINTVIKLFFQTTSLEEEKPSSYSRMNSVCISLGFSRQSPGYSLHQSIPSVEDRLHRLQRYFPYNS